MTTCLFVGAASHQNAGAQNESTQQGTHGMTAGSKGTPAPRQARPDTLGFLHEAITSTRRVTRCSPSW